MQSPAVLLYVLRTLFTPADSFHHSTLREDSRSWRTIGDVFPLDACGSYQS